MVHLLCDVHLSDALERTTALLMVLLCLTCVCLAMPSTLAGSMQPEGGLLRILSSFHHRSICLLPCPNARRWVWHHIFKFTAKLYILSNNLNWIILVSAHMLPRLLSVFMLYLHFKRIGWSHWSSASSPILLGLQRIHTALKPKDAKWEKKWLLHV